MRTQFIVSYNLLFFCIFISLWPVTGCQKETVSDKKLFTNRIGMAFVRIPAGNFTMGSPDTEPKRHRDEVRHTVTLSRGFNLGITEVTQGQWIKVMGQNPSEFIGCGEDCPVESISWTDVQNFIQKLNQMDGDRTYRLPTEAEWEYACRAGTEKAFSYGKCLSSDQANFDGRRPLSGCPGGSYRETPVPVASFPPNPYGLYDMHGNVWEWCRDWYGSLPSDPASDPSGPSTGKYRVVRGGSWYSLDDDCRSANRDRSAPNLRLKYIGFRLVMMTQQ